MSNQKPYAIMPRVKIACGTILIAVTFWVIGLQNLQLTLFFWGGLAVYALFLKILFWGIEGAEEILKERRERKQ